MADGSLGEPSCWQDVHGCSVSERLLGQKIMLVKRARVKLFLAKRLRMGKKLKLS